MRSSCTRTESHVLWIDVTATCLIMEGDLRTLNAILKGWHISICPKYICIYLMYRQTTSTTNICFLLNSRSDLLVVLSVFLIVKFFFCLCSPIEDIYHYLDGYSKCQQTCCFQGYIPFPMLLCFKDQKANPPSTYNILSLMLKNRLLLFALIRCDCQTKFKNIPLTTINCCLETSICLETFLLLH